MKKNAFTLIELLATITILGIIMTISVVSYSKYIKHSENESYKDAEITMAAAAESYYTYCQTSIVANNVPCQELPNVGEVAEIPLETLTTYGFMKSVPDQKENKLCTGKVIVKNNGHSTNYDIEYKACLICSDYESESCK